MAQFILEAEGQKSVNPSVEMCLLTNRRIHIWRSLFW